VEPLLSFGHRALVHFAVSNDLAAMTTRLEGDKTHFLPFNTGHEGGAGNPSGEGGWSATAYLWQRVWDKDAWLTIIGRLMIVQTKEEWDVATGTSVRRTQILFPRFHQREAVTSLEAALRQEGAGQRYLIERSAGSGKTNTIAWTAHRLARLHVDDEKVFDSVIVVVDRTVLDGQLQDAIRQIDVEAIVAAEMTERAESKNISYFAFTVTPKNKTLELFSRKGLDGKPVEFHLYSMRHAIEEGYILDVLRGYQPYDTALKIAGQLEDSEGEVVVEEAAACKGLMRWVRLHPTNIGQKV
jgi:type I site-specific restriction-modification system R (restriction) subunit